MSDNVSIARIDADVSGIIEAAKQMAAAGQAMEKALTSLDIYIRKVEDSSKKAENATNQEVNAVTQGEQKKALARQKTAQAKLALANTEAKTAKTLAEQELEQVEQAEKRKTTLAETRAKQRLESTKNTSKQEQMILNSTLRAQEINLKTASSIEIINKKAEVKAVQDAEKAKQIAQKETHDRQMAMLSQVAAASAKGGIRSGIQPGFQGGAGGRGGGSGPPTILPVLPSTPLPSGGGWQQGVGGILNQVGAGVGGIGGAVAGLAGSLLTADIPGIIGSVINLGKASIDTAKQLFQSGVAAEHAAVGYQRQMAAATNLAGGQRNLAKVMDAYVEASGGAVDQTEALTNVIQLQALGFAKSAEDTKAFVTAARGISLAMGKGIGDVANEISLAVGNLSTRRLDQLGLSIGEVTTRTNELQKANASMGRQWAFQQAIIEAATRKFGDLAKSAIGQKTPVENMEADWKNFALTLQTYVTPAIETVAGWLDDLIKKATDPALRGALDNLRNKPLPNAQTTQETTASALGLGAGASPTLNSLEQRLASLTAARDTNLRFANSKDPFVLNKDSYRQAAADITKQIEDLGNDIARARAQFMLDASKVPGGPKLPYMTDPSRQPEGGDTRTPLKKFEDENVDMIAEHRQRVLDIDEKAYKAEFDADQDYHKAVEKSNAAFNLQLKEQAEDHNKQMAKEEKDYQDEVARIKRDAAEQAKIAERNLNQEIDRERRDSAAEQKRWLRDYNQSVANNNRDEKHQEFIATREYNEKKQKETDDYNKKIKEINDKYNDDEKKARRDHYDSLLEAASHLDAVAVYNEQRKFAKEEAERQKDHKKDLKDAEDAHNEQVKEAKSAYDEQIKDMRDANNQRNLDEKASYDQRVKDANAALAQQITDQKAALAQQLSDAQTADAQRLSDMKTAHDNQKTEEETAYHDQLEREKTHHNNELTELDTQHTNRINQIKTQQAEEQTTLQNEWDKQLAAFGFASANYVKAQEALQDVSLAIFTDWWRKQAQIMQGTAPTPIDQNTFSPMVGQLKDMGDDLTTQLGTAVATMNSKEIARLTDLLNKLNASLAPYNASLNGWKVGEQRGGVSASAANVVIKTDAPPVVSSSVSSASMGAGQLWGGYNVKIDNISIALGDVGDRSDSEIKKLVGDAMVYWVGEAVKSGNTTRW